MSSHAAFCSSPSHSPSPDNVSQLEYGAVVADLLQSASRPYGAAIAGAQTAGHPLLQRNLNGLPFQAVKTCHGLVHGGGAAGKDLIGLANMLVNQTGHQALHARRAVIGA